MLLSFPVIGNLPDEAKKEKEESASKKVDTCVFPAPNCAKNFPGIFSRRKGYIREIKRETHETIGKESRTHR